MVLPIVVGDLADPTRDRLVPPRLVIGDDARAPLAVVLVEERLPPASNTKALSELSLPPLGRADPELG